MHFANSAYYSKHLSNCLCKWCIKDSVFYNSTHVLYCSCQWCKLDIGFSGAEINRKQTGYITQLYNVHKLSNGDNFKNKSIIDSFSLQTNVYESVYGLHNEFDLADEYVGLEGEVNTSNKTNAPNNDEAANGNNSVNESTSQLDNSIPAPDSQPERQKVANHYHGQSNLSEMHCGSLLKKCQITSNYSHCSNKGASKNNRLLKEGGENANINNNNALHHQWGLIFNEKLLAVSEVHCKTIDQPDMALWVQLAHREANKHTVPNYRGARIKVRSGLNVKQFRHLLQNYNFSRVIDYVEFGFPLALDYTNFTYIEDTANHKSAIQYPKAVTSYLETEISHRAIVGPFESAPFEHLHVSPMMTRPKPDGNRRIIVDLSWPKGEGVNSRIADNELDSHPCTLKYPTIDNIIQAIVDTGKDARLFKVDLQRAYRNLRTDPRDLSVLGLQWGKYKYVDVSVPFGLKSGASACQSVTDCVTHLLATAGHWTCSYLDDVIGVAPAKSANNAFLALTNLITSLGLPINLDKVSAPVTRLTCLGIEIDVETGMLHIPTQKLSQIKSTCEHWMTKNSASKKQLQSLVGHLIYLHKCITPARLFVNRVLTTLRNAPTSGRINLDEAFYRDITWFCKFMESYNGVSKIHTQREPEIDLYVDACLLAVGAYSHGKVYNKNIPICYKSVLSIVHYEMVNVIIAFRTWGHLWKDKWVQVFCDNSAVVHILNTGASRDVFLAACARTLWLLKAKYNIKVTVRFIAGTDNKYADILSRWQHFQNINNHIVKYLKGCQWFEVNSHDFQPDFSV